MVISVARQLEQEMTQLLHEELPSTNPAMQLVQAPLESQVMQLRGQELQLETVVL